LDWNQRGIHRIHKKINLLDTTIKFTSECDFDKKSTTFLDTTLTIKNGKIKTDLYRKETDKVQYLLPSSCHPSHIFKSVPYSLGLRLVRICSDREDLKKRLFELEEMLLSRGYSKNIVKETTLKALTLDRAEILKKVTKTKKDRVVLAVTYHPKLPSVSSIISKHYKTLSKDQKAKETFPLPPMVAFKQPPNLRNKLVHAKLPTKGKSKRQVNGIRPCNKPCGICPYVLQSNQFISTATKERFQIKGTFNCNTSGVIYLTTCSKCLIQYVGQTGRRLVDRINLVEPDIFQRWLVKFS
jgi:peptide-methionine (R)-S-oxide reductase